jgi:hypothetical protein
MEEEAREKLAELRNRKEQLLREIQGFAKKKDVGEDVAQAVHLTQSDLDHVL